MSLCTIPIPTTDPIHNLQGMGWYCRADFEKSLLHSWLLRVVLLEGLSSLMFEFHHHKLQSMIPIPSMVPIGNPQGNYLYCRDDL